jgi:hypothetical protein
MYERKEPETTTPVKSLINACVYYATEKDSETGFLHLRGGGFEYLVEFKLNLVRIYPERKEHRA